MSDKKEKTYSIVVSQIVPAEESCRAECKLTVRVKIGDEYSVKLEKNSIKTLEHSNRQQWILRIQALPSGAK
jgi:hypothetical protein